MDQKLFTLAPIIVDTKIFAISSGPDCSGKSHKHELAWIEALG